MTTIIEGTEETHVQVQFSANGKPYSYELAEPLRGHVQKGHAVRIDSTPQGTEWARVCGFGSSYAGQCKMAYQIINETEQPAGAQQDAGHFDVWTGASE